MNGPIRPLCRPLVALATLAYAGTAMADTLPPLPRPNPVQEAQATPPMGMLCRPRDRIIAILNGRFGETQRSFGLQSDRRVLEIYASEKGSWTALLTLPNGQACVVATGEAWNQLPVPESGDPA